MSGVPYDYDWYRSFLDRCREAGFKFRLFDEGVAEGAVFLRHDVDFSPRRALEKARIEADAGVRATYFFLVTSPFYNSLEEGVTGIIREVSELDHAIGLHFASEVHFDREPETDRLRRQIETDRSVLASRTEELAETIAFHNPPDWVIDREFDGLSHTYEPRFLSRITYSSDSLGRWRDDPPFPDGIGGLKTIQILTHPTFWGEVDASPKERIEEARQDLCERVDAEMQAYSRLDWS
jgi:hypothetical protein